MNAAVPLKTPVTLDDIHLLRSRLVERFAQFESLLLSAFAAAGIKQSEKSPLGQRLEAATIAISAKESLNKFERRLAALLDKAAWSLALRNELVHGTMQLALVDGEAIVLVKNANTALLRIDQRTVVTPEMLKQATTEISQLSNQLTQMLNPPLPRQPSQAAAAAP